MSTIEDTRVYESRYQQIAVEMAEKIAEGWYEVGDRITSRSTIATTFPLKQLAKQCKFS